MKNIADSHNEVESFVDDFLGGKYSNKQNKEYLIQKFTTGYCYHFAHMLKVAFKRGKVCWAAPSYHFVWLDTNNNPYDINGYYDKKLHKTMYFIPEKYIKKFVNDFLHTKSSQRKTLISKEELIQCIKDYCKDNNQAYDEKIEWLV